MSAPPGAGHRGPAGRLLDGLILLAGGRPDVVRPLTRGLLRAADGGLELLWARSSGSFVLSPQGARILAAVLAALGSVLVVGLMIMTGRRVEWAAYLLAGAHWAVVGVMALVMGGPSLLVDEDAAVLGWWPLTRRDLLLARLGALLRPLLEVSLALTMAPLVAFAFAGSPPVAAAILLAVGLLLQTLAAAMVVIILLQTAARLGGPRHARRLATLLTEGAPLLFFLPLLLAGLLEERWDWIEEHGSTLALLLPPFWFGAWGLPLAGGRTLLAAAAGLVGTAALGALGFHVLARPAAPAERIESVSSYPSRRHWSRLVSAALIPWSSGREGHVTRRLLEHHLREDWRFVGAMLAQALLFGVMIFIDEDVDPRAATGLVNFAFVYWVTLWAPGLAVTMQYSSRPQALWVVALGDLDPARMLAAQRGILRGLALAPVLAIYAGRAAALGFRPWVIAADALILAGFWELMITLVQTRQRSLPFCCPFNQDRKAERLVNALLGVGMGIAFLALTIWYEGDPAGRVALALLLPLAIGLALRRQRRRLAGTRLRMGVLEGGN